MRYESLDLEAFDYQKKDGAETFRVRVANSPVGEQRLSDAENSLLKADLRKRLSLLEKRLLDLPGMIELGIDLGDALFPPKARSFLERSRASLDDQQGLRIRLRLDNYTLSDLPWEYTYLPDRDTPATQRNLEGFLVLDRKLSLVRYEVLGQSPGKLGAVGNAQVAVILANPQSAEFPPLDLAGEQDVITKALDGVSQIQSRFYPDATVEMLLDAINGGAHVLHFSGHGTFQTTMGEEFGSTVGEGFVVLTGDDGKELLFSSGSLAVSLKSTRVRLVVLGACEGGRRDGVNAWTGVAPALTRAGIPAVVGMQYKIYDKNAVRFSRSFYRSLAAGNEIDEAVTDGRVAILTARSNEMERDWGVPVLYLHAEEGVLFPRLADTSSPPEPRQPRVSPPPKSTEVNLRDLRIAMKEAFDIDGLKILCADLEAMRSEDNVAEELNLDVLGGSSKDTIIMNLIDNLKRRRQIPYLLKAVRSARPGII